MGSPPRREAQVSRARPVHGGAPSSWDLEQVTQRCATRSSASRAACSAYRMLAQGLMLVCDSLGTHVTGMGANAAVKGEPEVSQPAGDGCTTSTASVASSAESIEHGEGSEASDPKRALGEGHGAEGSQASAGRPPNPFLEAVRSCLRCRSPSLLQPRHALARMCCTQRPQAYSPSQEGAADAGAAPEGSLASSNTPSQLATGTALEASLSKFATKKAPLSPPLSSALGAHFAFCVFYLYFYRYFAFCVFYLCSCSMLSCPCAAAPRLRPIGCCP